MKKKISPVLILSLLSSCSNFSTNNNATRSTASDDDHHRRPNYNGRYDGSPPEYKGDQWNRRPSAFTFCDKYKNETGKHVLACSAGVDEAMNMASRFAGGHGREDGYLRSYAWGMNQAINYNQDNQDEMQRGEASVDQLDSYLNTASNEGQTAGSRDGDSLGTSEAKNRFYRAVDTKVMPSPSYQVPAANFNPTQDAYTRYVGSIPTPEEILKRDRYGRIPFYGSFDHSYSGRDWHERNGRDMWSRDGVYNVNSNQWVDGDRAFQTWLEIGSPGRQRYDSLNIRVSFNEIDTNRAPAQVAPPRGGGDRPGGNGGPGGRPNNPNPPVPPAPPVAPVPPVPPVPPVMPTPPVVVPPVPVVDFQAIFREAFVQAYNAFAPFEYSKNFQMSLDIGQRDGENVGTEVGIEIAQKKGLARAFNRKFAQVSYNNYQNAYANTYSKGFQSTYDFYKNNSVLSLNFLGIVGSEDDGVVQPGEAFGVKFKVTNAGGVASKLTYTVSGDVEDPKTLNDSVNAISTKTITSPTIGDVLNTLEDGSRGTYVLDVNSLKEKLWQDIKRPLEFSDVSTNFSALDGSGMYNVTIANISTVPVNGAISFELRINGNSVKTVVGSAMQPGDKKSYALDFSSLDPLVWISGAYNVELLLKYNNVTFARRTNTLGVSDSVDSLAQYYTRLINEKGVVPAGKTLDNRTAEVRGMLLQRNSSEVSANIDGSGNIYRTNPEATIPGKIGRAKNSYPNNSARANGEFTSLADTMAPEAKKFKSLLFIHPKRDAYNELLGKIGGKTYK